MTAPIRIHRVFPRQHENGRAEQHWMLAGPDGVLTFGLRETTNPAFCDIEIDGMMWTRWCIEAHVPAARCNDRDSDHTHGVTPHGCYLLEGVPCCVDSPVTSQETFAAWVAAGRDERIVWDELERLFPLFVTAAVRSS